MDSNKSITHVSCEQADILLNEYIDGELDSVTAAAVEAHLAECKDCRHSCEQLRAICDAVSGTAEAVPPELHGRIMAAVHAEARASRRRRFVSRFGAGIAALLCLGVIATAAVRHMSDVPYTPGADSRAADVGGDDDIARHGIDDAVIVAQSEGGSAVYSLPRSNDRVELEQPTTDQVATADDAEAVWSTDDWVLALLGDGSFILERDGVRLTGQYGIADGLLTLRPDGCGDDRIAVYSYSVIDGHAEFAHVSGDTLLS